MKFTVSGGNIRFGLLAIKNLGAGMIDEIKACRAEDGPFEDFYTFCERMCGREINKRAIESLIKSGALDGLGANRRQMLAGLETVMSSIEENRRQNFSGQLGIFDMLPQKESYRPQLPDMPEFDSAELLAMERETTEMYLSGHPLSEYEQSANSMNSTRLSRIEAEAEEHLQIDGRHVTLLCMITSVKLKTTRSNETMAFVNIEDISGSAEMLVFPAVLTDNAAFIKVGNAVRIEGRVSAREEEQPKIICESVALAKKSGEAPYHQYQSRGDRPSGETRYESRTQPQSNNGQAAPKKSSRPGLYLRCSSIECAELERAKKVLRIFDGITPVYVYCEKGGLMSAPRELWVAPNDVMLRELVRILGSGNVKLVE